VKSSLSDTACRKYRFGGLPRPHKRNVIRIRFCDYFRGLAEAKSCHYDALAPINDGRAVSKSPELSIQPLPWSTVCACSVSVWTSSLSG
jgi:hypothetical protein